MNKEIEFKIFTDSILIKEKAKLISNKELQKMDLKYKGTQKGYNVYRDNHFNYYCVKENYM